MSDTTIVVQRLRLAAGSDAPVHGLRARVEDALRTSSKPPSLAHRFVLLRRLRLRLPRTASAQSLAVQLEAQWRAIESLAVAIEIADDGAEAVWADDEVQARLALLRRWLGGDTAVAWFWQRLLSGIDACVPLPLRLQRLLFDGLGACDAGAEGPSARRLWREAGPAIAAAGHAAALLAVLTPAQAAALQDVVARGRGADLAFAMTLPAPSLPAAPTVPGAPPAHRGDPSSAAPTPSARADGDRVAPRVDEPARRREAAPPAAGDDSAGEAPAASRPTTGAPPSMLPRGLQHADSAVVHPPATAAPAEWAPHPTDWAGLWFVLPMLRQLQLDTEPAAPCTFAMMSRRLAAAFGFDHPVRRWIDGLGDRCGLGAAPDDALAAASLRWQRVLRVHALQRARLPLRRVLLRPGRVLLAPHRIDVLLPLQGVDIRLRRAGFDIDPGYLPWLDCIVRFHYR